MVDNQGKIGCNVVENTTAFLYFDLLYILWQGKKWLMSLYLKMGLLFERFMSLTVEGIISQSILHGLECFFFFFLI